MKPSNTIVVSSKYIEEKEHQIADISKKVERLQEQLNEANEVIKDYVFQEYLTPETYEMRNKLEVYCRKWKVGEEKWGVK